MEKLKWTSPFTYHGVTHRRQPRVPSRAPKPAPLHPSATALPREPLARGRPRPGAQGHGGAHGEAVEVPWWRWRGWALRSASYFVEWELVAAKASSWLEQQEVPEEPHAGAHSRLPPASCSYSCGTGTGLEFNMLCYNPNYV